MISNPLCSQYMTIFKIIDDRFSGRQNAPCVILMSAKTIYSI